MKKTTKLTALLSTACLLTALSLHATDIRDGLVAYWPMNTEVGSGPVTTPDVVGGNDLTENNSFGGYLVPGQFGNGIASDGASVFLSLITAPGSDTGLPVSKGGSWTIALWVKGAPQAGGNTFFFEGGSTNATPYTGIRATANTNQAGVFIRDASGNNPVNYPTVTNVCIDNTWHHIALAYDAVAGVLNEYVDGNLAYTKSYVPDNSRNVMYDTVSLGARVRNGVNDLLFNGAVDDVALWARALSQTEIQTVKSSSISTPVPQFPPTVSVNPAGATNLLVGDNFTLSVGVYGSRPLYYQWLKNGTNYPGATTTRLAFPSLATNDSGQYALVVTNSSGSVTSTVAQITVNAFAAPNLTNGIIAYYPCDSIVAGKAPELVSAYDMPLFGGMNATNVVAGKWGNALIFDRSIPQYGKKIFAPSDSMPGIRRTNVTYSVWVNNNPVSSFQFDEASSTDPNTFQGFGGLGGAGIRMYIRNSSGTVYSDTQLGSPTIWDGNWHNVIYSQHAVGGGLSAQLYIDGNLVATPATSTTLLQPDTLAFCINGRSTLGSQSGGGIDEVVYWNRVLSPAEIALVQTSYITNPPSALPPLAITSFTADVAAVASGDSTVLRWDVPGNITSATISHVGDVTSLTTAGGGTATNVVSVTNTTTYTLTITRGVETVNKSVTIGAVTGVAPGWNLLDNFDFYKPGVLTTNGTWNGIATPDTMLVVQPSGPNHLAGCYSVDGNGSGGILNIQRLAVTAGQARTLFFRMTPKGAPAANVLHEIGISERVGTFFYYMTLNNSGPMAYPKWDSVGTAWLMGVSTNTGGSGTYAYDANPLTADAVYKVWIDVTNVPIVNVPGARVMPDEEDLFSVYIQKEGDPSRTALFVNVPSDRALNNVDDFTGHYPDDNINKLYILGNSYSGDVLFDDIYLSKTGINSGTPIGAGYAGPAPALQIQWNGSAWQIIYDGTLQQASPINGGWSNVTGATSPYVVPTTTGTQKFYRAVIQ